MVLEAGGSTFSAIRITTGITRIDKYFPFASGMYVKSIGRRIS